jgi:hypothetical protein
MSPFRIEARLRLTTWLLEQEPDEAARIAHEAIDIAVAKGATALAAQARRFVGD